MKNRIKNWLASFLGFSERFDSLWKRMEYINELGVETDRRRHLLHDGLKTIEKRMQLIENRVRDIEKEIHDRISPIEMSLSDYRLIMSAIREHLGLKLMIEQIPDPSYVQPELPPVPMVKRYKVITEPEKIEPILTNPGETVNP